MTRKLLVGAIVAGALTVTAGTAFALSQDDQSSSNAAPTTTSSPTSLTTAPTTSSSTSSSAPTSSSSSSGSAPAKLTADDAARIAQARVGGTVHEVEREVEHGRLEWKVEITAADGVTYDMRIDAVTGDLTRVDQDDDRGDDHGRHGGDDRDDDHGRHGGDDHDDD
jgi:uncharacterized membrane protein YkoI